MDDSFKVKPRGARVCLWGQQSASPSARQATKGCCSRSSDRAREVTKPATYHNLLYPSTHFKRRKWKRGCNAVCVMP